MFWDNFLRLCNQVDKSPNAVASEIGIKSSGSVTAWKNGTVPYSRTLQKIADYFGISKEELLSNEQKETPASNADGVDDLDVEALDIMHQLPPEKRAAALAMLRGLLSN